MSHNRYVPPTPTLERIAHGLSMPVEDLRKIAESYRREMQRHTAHEQTYLDSVRRVKQHFPHGGRH